MNTDQKLVSLDMDRAALDALYRWSREALTTEHSRTGILKLIPPHRFPDARRDALDCIVGSVAKASLSIVLAEQRALRARAEAE